MRLTIRKNRAVYYQIKLYDISSDEMIYVNGGKSLKNAQKIIFNDYRDAKKYKLIKIDLNVNL